MPKLKPFSEMNGITDEKSAREYISAIARNIGDQTATSTMIAVEWGIDPSYITNLLLMENERAQKDMILDAIKFLDRTCFLPSFRPKDEEEEK